MRSNERSADTRGSQMQGMSIRDLSDSRPAFDLRDLLEALGPTALTAWWRCRTPVWYIAKEDVTIDALEWRDGEAEWVRGSQLLKETQALHQVVDGVIESVRSEVPPVNGSLSSWVVLRAVDSSWWELYSDDSTVLAAVRDRFGDVRDPTYTADDPATDY
jgi:hypothetical protein